MSGQKVMLVFPVLAMVVNMANAEVLTLGYYKYSSLVAEKIVQRVNEQYITHVPC